MHSTLRENKIDFEFMFIVEYFSAQLFVCLFFCFVAKGTTTDEFVSVVDVLLLSLMFDCNTNMNQSNDERNETICARFATTVPKSTQKKR